MNLKIKIILLYDYKSYNICYKIFTIYKNYIIFLTIQKNLIIRLGIEQNEFFDKKY